MYVNVSLFDHHMSVHGAQPRLVKRGYKVSSPLSISMATSHFGYDAVEAELFAHD
jgi:hypothetical protein